MYFVGNFFMDAYHIIKSCVLCVAKFQKIDNKGVKPQKNVYSKYKIKKSKL